MAADDTPHGSEGNVVAKESAALDTPTDDSLSTTCAQQAAEMEEEVRDDDEVNDLVSAASACSKDVLDRSSVISQNVVEQAHQVGGSELGKRSKKHDRSGLCAPAIADSSTGMKARKRAGGCSATTSKSSRLKPVDKENSAVDTHAALGKEADHGSGWQSEVVHQGAASPETVTSPSVGRYSVVQHVQDKVSSFVRTAKSRHI